jgi:hypothetical protein
MIHQKARFWAGLSLCIVGIGVSSLAGTNVYQHVAGVLLLLSGLVGAARHAGR